MLPDFEMLAGFHAIESDPIGPYAWTQGTFSLRPNRAARFARFQLCYYGDQGQLTVTDQHGQVVDEVELHTGWHRCLVRLNAVVDEPLTFHVSPIIPVPGDSRELAIMVRSGELFDDERQYDVLTKTDCNARLNAREFSAGATVLKSYPPQLRVSMEVRCNLPETGQACVYCAWDHAKSVEVGSPPFSYQTLEDLGDFYRCATEVVDCSIGEPTMKKDFNKIVSQVHQDGKFMSMTTNGQLLVENRRQELLGKDMILYVSIDSATAEGYSRYRNKRFDDIIRNLTELCREKKKHDNLPRVFVTFLVMRSNVAELPQYLDLMKQVGVDEVKLRSLNLDSVGDQKSVVNNGYAFNYAEEILSMEELAALDPVVRQMAQERGVDLYNETLEFTPDAELAIAEDDHAESNGLSVVTTADQGCGKSCGCTTDADEVAIPVAVACDTADEEHAAHASSDPFCAEPWKTLYFLRRGIMPCCYGVVPVATWDQQGDRSLNEFLGDVFNNETMQEIRSELAQGRFAPYCLNTPSCPILKRRKLQGLVDVSADTIGIAAPQSMQLPMVALESLVATARPAA